MKQGLPIRPTLPLQEETLKILHRYFAEHGNQGKACFVAMPHIPIMNPLITTAITAESEDTQKDRERMYRKRRQQLKQENDNLNQDDNELD